jgi:hypothetical protein
MRYYNVQPEVAGHWGKNTVVDRSVNPPEIRKLHYIFDDWSRDPLLESYPCFIVVVELSQAIERARLTGVRFASVETSASQQLTRVAPGFRLPEFRWMQVLGRPGEDDFGISKDRILVASERALELLRRFGMSHAEVQSAKP